MQINLSIVPPADAPGAVTVLVDGLGTQMGAVAYVRDPDRLSAWGLLTAFRAGVVCCQGAGYGLIQQAFGVRMPIGRRAFRLTISTRAAVTGTVGRAGDIRPAARWPMRTKA